MDKFIQQLAREAGEMGKEYFYGGVSHTAKEGKYDLLTEADNALSEFIVSKIQETYPDHHVFSEEMDEQINKGAEYEWVIDPIDGTYNFAHSMPMWAVMITLVHKGDAIMAVIYFPMSDRLFFAEKGKGTYLNGEKVSLSKETDFNDSTGIVYRCPPHPTYGEKNELYRKVTAKIASDTDIRMCNYAGICVVSYVASGSFDFAFANGGMDWDLLPIMLICSEAGAICTHSDGSPWQRGRQDYVIANPTIHPQMIAFIEEHS